VAVELPVSPSAERNKGPILEVLQGILPEAGSVLEIASGTGQHVVHFAAACPTLSWQPSERDPVRLADLAARIAAARLPNVRAPLVLDALEEPWPVAGPLAAVLAINLIHIAPWPVTTALVRGAARVLGRWGVLVLYGPYREQGRHTAPSNENFDANLRGQDPSYGVRDLEAVAALAAEHGFSAPIVTRMPSNNLTLVFRRLPGG
jgi:SAM-dependent methyltransferase